MTNTATGHRPSDLEGLDHSEVHTPRAFDPAVARLPGGDLIGTRWRGEPRVLLRVEQDDEHPVCTAILDAFRFQQIRQRGNITATEWVAIVPRIAAQMLHVDKRGDHALLAVEDLALDPAPRTTVETLAASDETTVLTLLATISGRTQWLEFDEVCHLCDELLCAAALHGVHWCHVLELAGDIDDLDLDDLNDLLGAAYATS